MPTDSTLSIVVKMKDEASAQLEALASKAAGIGDSMVAVGQKMQSAGQAMTIGLTVPIVALGTAVITTSQKFQSSMELIHTQAGATQAEVANMTKAVLDLAKSGETGQGPQALADGLYHIESLGFRGAQALDMLKTSAQAADVGMASMEGVTNALGAALVTGIKGTETMNGAMGILNATIGSGNMRMDDLVAALGTGILPAAKNFGLSLTDVGAALATLTDNGMRADESATRLRMTFSLMAAPTAKATKALAEVGLSSMQLANDMRNNGLVAAVQDLKQHLEDSGKSATEQAQILSAAFGGGRTSAAILTLVEQLDRLKNKYTQIGDQAGVFNEAVAATHQNNIFKYNEAMARVQATMIDLGGTVMPLVAQALDKMSVILVAVVAWWDKLSPGVQKFIVIALALLAVLGPILVILGSLITAIGTIWGAIVALGTAAGVTSVGMAALGTATAGFLAEVGLAIIAVAPYLIALAALAAAIILVTNAYSDMQSAANGALASGSKLQTDVKKLDPLIANATGDRKAKLEKLKADSQQAANSAVTFGQQHTGAGGFVRSIVEGLGSYLPKFAGGGIIPGSPGQAVPIIAHAGEEVIPASGVGRNGRGGGVINLHFNFNGATAGDDGIRQIIKQAVGEMNRAATLRGFGGA